MGFELIPMTTHPVEGGQFTGILATSRGDLDEIPSKKKHKTSKKMARRRVNLKKTGTDPQIHLEIFRGFFYPFAQGFHVPSGHQGKFDGIIHGSD